MLNLNGPDCNCWRIRSLRNFAKPGMHPREFPLIYSYFLKILSDTKKLLINFHFYFENKLPGPQMEISWAAKLDSTLAGMGTINSKNNDTICPPLGFVLLKYFWIRYKSFSDATVQKKLSKSSQTFLQSFSWTCLSFVVDLGGLGGEAWVEVAHVIHAQTLNKT